MLWTLELCAWVCRIWRIEAAKRRWWVFVFSNWWRVSLSVHGCCSTQTAVLLRWRQKASADSQYNSKIIIFILPLAVHVARLTPSKIEFFCSICPFSCSTYSTLLTCLYSSLIEVKTPRAKTLPNLCTVYKQQFLWKKYLSSSASSVSPAECLSLGLMTSKTNLISVDEVMKSFIQFWVVTCGIAKTFQSSLGWKTENDFEIPWVDLQL